MKVEGVLVVAGSTSSAKGMRHTVLCAHGVHCRRHAIFCPCGAPGGVALRGICILMPPSSPPPPTCAKAPTPLLKTRSALHHKAVRGSPWPSAMACRFPGHPPTHPHAALSNAAAAYLR